MRRPALHGETLTFGTVSDPYQPCETHYRLTRQLLAICGEAGNPMTLTTKSTLVTQDLTLLAMLARGSGCAVNITITTLDADVARRLEPRAPSPDKRLRAITTLATAGVPVGVFLAPILPGITDGPGAIEALIDQVAAHGATYLMAAPLRIGEGFAELLLRAIGRDFPEHRRHYQQLARSGGMQPGPETTRLKGRVAMARNRARLASGPPLGVSRRPTRLGLHLKVA